jgi:hypothetical protein
MHAAPVEPLPSSPVLPSRTLLVPPEPSSLPPLSAVVVASVGSTLSDPDPEFVSVALFDAVCEADALADALSLSEADALCDPLLLSEADALLLADTDALPDAEVSLPPLSPVSTGSPSLVQAAARATTIVIDARRFMFKLLAREFPWPGIPAHEIRFVRS